MEEIFELKVVPSMIWSLMEGIGMGLVLSLMIGPVFFALIQNSIENGFEHSVFMAFGITLSDAIYVVITYFGISYLAGNQFFNLGLGYLGGIILIGFALFTWNSPKTRNVWQKGEPAKKGKGFLKGIGLNGINPFVFLFWISIASLVNLKTSYGLWDKLGFYLAILITVFSVDLIKAYTAQQLCRHINLKFVRNLNRTVAILLFLFGIRMIYFAVVQHQVS